MSESVEISWFSALCDDDYEFLGVPDPSLQSSWAHCSNIVKTADRLGFDNVLLPSGYTLGIDSTAFAAGIATHTEQIQLLLAVRMGEMWLPQLARQLATIDQMAGGRLTVNIISSDIPGSPLESEPRYQRTREWMDVLRQLLNGESIDFHGDFVNLTLDPPRIRTVSGKCPPFYFGGFSEPAKETAAEHADVFLTWPDTVAGVAETVTDMKARAERFGREMNYGLRAHVIVRETEDEARAAADRLLSKLDDDKGEEIRQKSLDTASAGVARQNELRNAASGDGFVEENLWTGVGRARSGAGAAIVGDPDQVLAKLKAYQAIGVGAFILSGYTHAAEADLFARHVLPNIDHGPLYEGSST
ncbi:MAG: LLM class flavin-dependent oxidoreductase [Acidimicrobiales bacterium]|nr:LLM class flavin-dependent oxidoreductase [Acidimicrobiales bacterium]RZV46274.1 MAG: LLM class flavin-dependent oxidoreductase [Acidimicrobiales bacterium]